MSDPLDRLVARHTSEPAIRPRVAARFEHGASPAPAVVEDLEAVAAAQPSPFSRPRLSSESESRPPEFRPPMPVPAASRGIQTARPAHASPRAGVVPSVVQAAAATADGAPERGSAVLAQPLPAPLGPAARPDAPRSNEPGGPAATLTAAVSPVPLIRPEHANTRPAEASPARNTGSARRETAFAAAEGREPDVIQVHIGRIEVRAVLPAPERRLRREPLPQPLALDRYLGQRT